ncbi:MAG: hypothetical protein P8Y42_22810, partial [Exilibacterium sp.]
MKFIEMMAGNIYINEDLCRTSRDLQCCSITAIPKAQKWPPAGVPLIGFSSGFREAPDRVSPMTEFGNSPLWIATYAAIAT